MVTLNLSTKLLVTTLGALGAGEWARTKVLPARPGLQRLIWALPALIFYWTVPFLFDRQVEMLSRASVTAIFFWLASFKLLALVLNRGALVQPSLAWHQFHALLTWPILPITNPDGSIKFVEVQGGKGGSVAVQVSRRLTHRVPEYMAVCLVCLWGLTHPAVPLFVKAYAAAFGVCSYCTLWANACAAMVMWLHGLEVSPSWDRPWLQTSMADFWGRRWNLPASASLRNLVHDPLVEGRLVAASPFKAVQPSLKEAAADSAVRSPAASASAPVALLGNTAYEPAGPMSTATPAIDDAKSGNVSATDEARTSSTDVASKASDGVGGGDGGEGMSRHRGGSSSGSGGRRDGKPRVSRARRALGMAGSFLLSGAMHEVLLYVSCGNAAIPMLGRQTLYFAMQVPLMLAEQQLKAKAAREGWSLPVWASIPIASLSLQIPGYYLFWTPYFEAVTAVGPPHTGQISKGMASVIDLAAAASTK